MVYNDSIAKNIRKQIALNAGPLKITSQPTAGSNISTGAIKWVDTSTNQNVQGSGSAASWLAQNTPLVVTAPIRAQTYNSVKGVFQQLGTPDAVLEPLVAAASYYIEQTGADISKLYNTKTGTLDSGFISVYNALRNAGSQIGTISANPTPSWQNSPLLRGNIGEYLG